MKHFLIQTLVILLILCFLLGIHALVVVPYVYLMGPGPTAIVVLGLGLMGGMAAERVVAYLNKELT